MTVIYFDFRFPCPLKHCPFSTTSTSSLRTHWFKKHNSQYKHNLKLVPQLDPEPDQVNDIPNPHHVVLPLHKSFSDVLGNLQDSVSNKLISFFLQARDVHCVADSTATKLAKFNQSTLQQFSTEYLSLFKTFLNDNNIHIDEPILEKLNLETFFDSKDSLLNDANVLSVLHHHYNFVAPVEISFENTSEKLYYVPIKETILSVCQNPTFRAYIVNKCPQATYFKSLHFTNHTCHLAENAVFIKLYSDEFEVCNPIGSAKKNTKLLQCIFLFLIFQIMYLQICKIFI